MLIKVNYLLACGDIVNMAGGMLSATYCPRCQKIVAISTIEVMEWRVNCRTCKFSRWTGRGGKDVAKVFANGHRSRNSGHDARAEYAENPAAKQALAKFESWQVRTKSGAAM